MFWERLYNLCEELNIKPNTIAKEIGLSTAIATKWKNGAIPKGEVLVKIADYLNCSTDYLLGRSDDKKQIKFITSNLSATSSAIIENLSFLNDAGCEYILKQIEFAMTQPSFKK